MTVPEWKDHHTAVMLWAARDDTAAMTAERTGISLHMVRAYRHQAVKTLGRHSIHGAVAETIRQGILIITEDGVDAGENSETTNQRLAIARRSDISN